MQENTILNVVNTISQSIVKGTFGINITTLTEPKMNKRNNPYFGRVQKFSVYANASIGTSYENSVNNRLERNGFERTFETEKPRGKHFFNPYFYQSDKDDSIFYLKIGMYQNTIVKSKYLIDGRLATTDEINEIKTFLPSHKVSQKQLDSGLTEETAYKLVSVKLDNVLKVSQGTNIIYESESLQSLSV